MIVAVAMVTWWLAGRAVRNLDRTLGPRYEARAWLARNTNPSALASNRFESTEQAQAFVERLYGEGALAVYVTNVMDEAERIAEEGGPYADAVVVVLPLEPERRAALFRMVSTEIRREGFEPERDSGQAELFLWWD